MNQFYFERGDHLRRTARRKWATSAEVRGQFPDQARDLGREIEDLYRQAAVLDLDTLEKMEEIRRG